MKRLQGVFLINRAHTFFILFLFVGCFGVASQVLKNEKIVIGFKTKNEKILTVAKDTADTYLVYRYGSAQKVALEFPKEKTESWERFFFSNYLRGGGKTNEGMHIGYLYFENEGYTYVVYQEYLAALEKTRYGIKVIEDKTGKTTNIEALESSVKGSLYELGSEKRIKKGDRLFM